MYCKINIFFTRDISPSTWFIFIHYNDRVPLFLDNQLGQGQKNKKNKKRNLRKNPRKNLRKKIVCNDKIKKTQKNSKKPKKTEKTEKNSKKK